MNYRFGKVRLTGIVELKDAHRGESGVFLCDGPTLDDYDDRLPPRHWKRFAIAGAIERIRERADYWVVSDVEDVEKYAKACPRSVTVLAMHEATTVIHDHCPGFKIRTVTSMAEPREYRNGFQFYSRGTLLIGTVELARYMGIHKGYVFGLDLFDAPADDAWKPDPRRPHKGRYRGTVTALHRRAVEKLRGAKEAELWDGLELHAVGSPLSAQDAIPPMSWEQFDKARRYGVSLNEAKGLRQQRELAKQREAILSLRNRGVGRLLVVVACGPSIMEAELPRLMHHPLIDTLSINTPDPRIFPTTYWAFADDEVYDRDPELVRSYQGILLNAWGVVRNRPEMARPNQVLMTYQDAVQTPFSRNMLRGVVLGCSTTFANLQVAFWMNYDRVFVFGCDMCKPPSAEGLHFHSRHEMEPGERLKRFEIEAGFFQGGADELSRAERRKIVFCSAYNPWPFMRSFQQLDHRRAVDQILALAESMHRFGGLGVAQDAGQGSLEDEAPSAPLIMATWRRADADDAPEAPVHTEVRSAEDLIDRLKRRYDGAPGAAAELEAASREPLAEHLDAVAHDLPANLGLGYLDRYGQARSLSRLFAHLPPEALVEEFGPESLLWAWLNYPYLRPEAEDPLAQRLVEGGVRLLEWEADCARKARRALWERSIRNAEQVKLLHDMLESARRGDAGGIDLAEALQAGVEEGKPIPHDTLAAFRLAAVVSAGAAPRGWSRRWPLRNLGEDRLTGVYLDGPLGLVLTHAGAPVATASFLFEDLWTLTVLQLEPVHEVRWDPANPSRDLADPAALAACERRAAEVLAGFDWQKGMIEVLERYARGWGFVTLALQTGRKRAEGWGPAGAVRGHETLAGGTASYDKLAERLGFYQRANGDWYRTFKKRG